MSWRRLSFGKRLILFIVRYAVSPTVFGLGISVAVAALTLQTTSIDSDSTLAVGGTNATTITIGRTTQTVEFLGNASTSELRTPSSTITTLRFTNASGTNQTLTGYVVAGNVSSTNVSSTNLSASGYLNTAALVASGQSSLVAVSSSNNIEAGSGNLISRNVSSTNVTSTNLSASGYLNTAALVASGQSSFAAVSSTNNIETSAGNLISRNVSSTNVSSTNVTASGYLMVGASNQGIAKINCNSVEYDPPSLDPQINATSSVDVTLTGVTVSQSSTQAFFASLATSTNVIAIQSVHNTSTADTVNVLVSTVASSTGGAVNVGPVRLNVCMFSW